MWAKEGDTVRATVPVLLGVLALAAVTAFSLSLILGDDGGVPARTMAPRSAARQGAAPAPGSDSVATDCRIPPELLPEPGAVSPNKPPSSTPAPPGPDSTVISLPPECFTDAADDNEAPSAPSITVNGIPIYLPDGTRLYDYRAVTDQDAANPPPPIIELWVGQSWVKFNVQEGVLLESNVKPQDAKTLQPLLEALNRP